MPGIVSQPRWLIFSAKISDLKNFQKFCWQGILGQERIPNSPHPHGQDLKSIPLNRKNLIIFGIIYKSG